MSDRSAITTRSKLRRLEADMNKRRAIEADSGVPSEMAPGSPSIAPTTSSVPAPVIPLAGGRVVDHREMVTPVRSGITQGAVSGISHVSSKSGQRSAAYLRRRVEYEAERELVRLKENLVKKKLEVELAEIDVAAEEDSGSDEEGTTRRVEDWVADTTPAAVTETPAVSREPPPPSRNVSVPPRDISPALQPCAPATVQFRDPPRSVNATHVASPVVTREPSREVPEWENAFTEETDRSRSRDRKIDQLADAISNLARPRPVPRQAYELPFFNGDPAEWLSYKNMYHDTTALYQFKPHENLARLKTSLQGDAKLAVEDLLRTSMNPSEIMKTLDEEFGHPNLVLECALKKVRALPKVTESGRELRAFSTTVRNCVSLLKSVRANGYLNNPQLVSELLNKLTPVQRAQYGDFAMGMAASQGIDMRVSPSLEMLAEFLSHLARATSYYVQMDMSSVATTSNSFKTRANVQIKPNRNVQRLHVHSDNEQQHLNVSEEKCTLCKEPHKLPKCKKFADLSVDDRWQHVKQQKLCFKCIIKRHGKNFCRASKCSSCNYAHHTLLHAERKTESVTNVSEYSGKALLKIMPVCISIDGNEKQCYALLDDGATVSLIDDSLAAGTRGKQVPLVLHSARGHEIRDEASRVISVVIRGPNGKNHKVKCRTLKSLNLPAQTVPATVMMEHAHIRDLGCEEMRGARPLLLLGQDNWELLVSQETRRGKSGKPVASLTELGWVVHGPLGKSLCDTSEQMLNCVIDSTVDLHELVRKQFELEALGISEVPRKHKDIERANEILESTSRQTESGAWEIGLLWRHDDPQLPDNYVNARQRLAGIQRRLCRDAVYAEAYTAQIDRLLSEGYASKLDDGVKADPVWYLPHFGVKNPNKPGKLRLVFDAAASCNGTTLNDNLLAGPDLLNSLLGVLFKFRLGPIAFTGDIADMFLRVKIREQDRGAQLFLWSATGEKNPDVYVMNSMIFGAVSSPTSAIYILNRNADKFRDRYPEAVAAIHTKHYMDDYLDSAWSVAQASRLIEEVAHIHAKGGFIIRGWITNSQELRDRLRIEMPEKVSLEKSEGATERTLGLTWSPSSDRLGFDLSFKRLPRAIVEGQVVPTKREFLRFIMSIFDPLGFLYPCIIQSRILMKRIWHTGIQWDEQLQSREAKVWFEWLQNLQHLTGLSVPRWYGLNLEKLELHVFGDASESAYAAVAYLAGIDAEGHRNVAIVIGKARVAPQKVVSIPRLELQAAVLACRLADVVEKDLGVSISQKYLWTDSKTVLKWINSEALEFQRFVSHRLAEIDKRSKRSNWRWVPSAMNPADTATRVNWPNNSDEWLSGPSFLRCPQEQWPTSNDLDSVTESELERVQQVHAVATPPEPLLRYERLPTWTRALYVVARLLIFYERCRKRRQSCSVTAEDLHEAELRLLRLAQTESYAADIATLRETRPLTANSKLRQLDPMLFQDGLVRVRGRLSACSELSFGERHPIILDGRHPLTRRLILNYHEAALHANQEAVVNRIREKYWVTNLRSSVKAVTASCQRCRLAKARPVTPKMGDLPAARLEITRRAFVHCGVDYFGPMEVAIGRRREKRWGVLFTCLTTRAVHLELASSLSADSAILALRRLIARRGRPADMYSDRGTNFVGAHAELRAALRDMNHDRLQSEAIGRGIAWHFNPPASPHMGGCWERLVRSVKNALKATLRERAPREEILYTLLAEAELTVNSRPLTYVSSDLEHPVVLTPNHLLLGTAAGDAPCTRGHAVDVDSRRMWRRVNALADLFWRRWLREYLPTLQRREKWNSDVQNVKIGDVVVVVDNCKPRNQWTKGVIKSVFPGADSVIRVVDIRTNNGVLRRPVVKIVVLPTDGSIVG